MSLTYHPITPILPSPDIFPSSVTALSFDPVSDTLWAGSNAGIVSAYYSAQGMRGVTFPIGGGLAVKSLIAGDSTVRATGLSSDGVGAWTKGGANKWFYRSPTLITAFSSNSAARPVFFASTSAQELLTISAHTGGVTRRSSTVSIVHHLVNMSNSLITGSSDGYVRTHDPRTSHTSVNAVQAHSNGIQGLRASGAYVYTIGLGLRQGHPYPDPLVKVYDTRALRPLPPVPFASGPAFIDVLPRRTSTIVVTSAMGLVNVVDVSNVSNTEFYQLDTQYVTSAAVSPSGTYMAFGDVEGGIFFLTSMEEGVDAPLNGFEGQPVEWADPPDPVPDIDWTEKTPLNSIGMPYYSEELLSSWTPRFHPPSYCLVAPPPPKIPPQVLSSIKFNDNVGYATLPKELKGRRNVVVAQAKRTQGRFRSDRSVHDTAEPETPVHEYQPDVIPRMYRKVEIEYSKFGVEDFDFGFYNRTSYSGLETHIINSYTNPLVQLLHYTHPIRRLAKSHITTDCQREHCLFCELGFVIRMLEDARGTNCQSSNFCKTIGVLAQANNLIELMDYGVETPDHNYSHMIQSFHRFMIDTMSSEGNSYPHNPWLLPHSDADSVTNPAIHNPAPAPITQLCGVDAKNIIVCGHCGAVREKENMLHVIDLSYPRKPTTNEATDFASILRSSLLRQTTHRATCTSCGKFATFESRRSIASKDLPPILALNAAVFSEENHRYWKDAPRTSSQSSQQPRFLKSTLEIQGQVNGVDDPDKVLYELRGMIVKIVTKEARSHLVSIIKIPEEEDAADSESESPWYLFNDFAVRSISEGEALSFAGDWKIPTVLYFERVDACSRLDFSDLPKEMHPSILFQDTNITINRDPAHIKHEVLSPEELPTQRTFVAIDAEFVSMQQEETEYRSDGTKKVIRPARLSLARVSVLRGDGPKEGVPFIDDHIHTSEVIVDYLTEFSGIKYGDLDPHLSRYTLTPLKVVYKKLRLLVDRGCIFIGHGLSKDFRIINIFVPPEQVIDTVDLYFIKSRQRRLSLRFLAWIILNENIQTDTHDSIEDALSALRLYKEYYKFEAAGTFDQKLEELYKAGKQYNWKPPPPPDSTTTTSAPTAMGSQGMILPQSEVLRRTLFPHMQGKLLQNVLAAGQYGPAPGALLPKPAQPGPYGAKFYTGMPPDWPPRLPPHDPFAPRGHK